MRRLKSETFWFWIAILVIVIGLLGDLLLIITHANKSIYKFSNNPIEPISQQINYQPDNH